MWRWDPGLGGDLGAEVLGGDQGSCRGATEDMREEATGPGGGCSRRGHCGWGRELQGLGSLPAEPGSETHLWEFVFLELHAVCSGLDCVLDRCQSGVFW